MKVLLIVGFGSKGPLDLIKWFTWGPTLVGFTDNEGKKIAWRREIAGGSVSLTHRRAKRTIMPPQKYEWDDNEVHFALITSSSDSTMFQEAMKSSETEGWMGAMIDEMESLKKNFVWS